MGPDLQNLQRPVDFAGAVEQVAVDLCWSVTLSYDPNQCPELAKNRHGKICEGTEFHFMAVSPMAACRK